MKITFKGTGDNDGVPYKAADITKACRLGDSVAISFYQLDYQAVVNQLISTQEYEASQHLIPACKVVLPLRAFQQMFNELSNLAEQLVAQGVMEEPDMKADEGEVEP